MAEMGSDRMERESDPRDPKEVLEGSLGEMEEEEEEEDVEEENQSELSVRASASWEGPPQLIQRSFTEHPNGLSSTRRSALHIMRLEEQLQGEESQEE